MLHGSGAVTMIPEAEDRERDQAQTKRSLRYDICHALQTRSAFMSFYGVLSKFVVNVAKRCRKLTVRRMINFRETMVPSLGGKMRLAIADFHKIRFHGISSTDWNWITRKWELVSFDTGLLSFDDWNDRKEWKFRTISKYLRHFFQRNTVFELKIEISFDFFRNLQLNFT